MSFPVPHCTRGRAEADQARRGLELIGAAVARTLGRNPPAPAGTCPECWRYGKSIPTHPGKPCAFCVEREERRAGK